MATPTPKSKSLCAQLLPLCKKTRRVSVMTGETALSGLSRELLRAACPRFDGIGAKQYANMVNAVEAALEPESTRPVILDVLESSDDDSCWYYAYWPRSRVIGMRFLQLLETLGERERTVLLLAAHHPDDFAVREPGLLSKYCGTEDIGRFERTCDVEDLDALLYHQKCRLAEGWEKL